MSSFIDTQLLRILNKNELLRELRTLRPSVTDEAITQGLLSAIGRGSISTSVFAAWFGICKTPYVISKALKQNVSVHIRLLGIKQLKTGLESAQWNALWDGLGGTAGLLELFSDLSVMEVKAACKAIGRCTRDGDPNRKRERITELFQGLHPNVFPEAAARTKDLRPLTKFYQELVPSCTAQFVKWVTTGDQVGRWQYVRERQLLEHHSDSIGTAAVHSVIHDQSADVKDKDRLQSLSTRFPSTMTPEAGFSASMAFALSLLRSVVETNVRHVGHDWILNNLIRPLLRRVIRKRASWSRTQEIVTLIIEYLKDHHEAARALTNAKGHVLHMVAVCWSRRSALFGDHLKYLLGLVFDTNTTFADIANILAGIPKSRRYALLHLACQEVMGVDLDREQDLSRARGPLSARLLSEIEPSDALGLLKRLRKARGDVKLVDLGMYSSVLVTTRTPDVYEGDPDIYYLILLNRNGMYEEAEAYAVNILEARKKMTKTTSNRETRAEHAVSVWACASASGSLRLLSETVLWAKGFVRDQLTASKMFSTYYDETYRLLSGFFVCDNATFRREDLHHRVQAANAIMISLLDIACSALREPFFRASDWRMTIDLFTRVVKERIEFAAKYKEDMGAGDEDMYAALWQDTIAVLLRAERVVNDEDFEKLGASTISGIVTWQSVLLGDASRSLASHTWKFLDRLAQARNDLWAELRPARFPDVLSLPAPFPRGLPVQHLLASWAPDMVNLPELAPYIALRAQSAVFVDPEAGLEQVNTDKATKRAIGAFVDNYQYALRVCIPDACEAQEKKNRLQKVWSHATGPLSATRMTSVEAVRYWKQFIPPHLRDILSDILPEKERVRWPVVPIFDDPSLTQEWNPLEDRPADIRIPVRKLGQATYIDLSTFGEQAQPTRPTVKSPYQPPKSEVPADIRSLGTIWRYNASGPETEAGCLAALLYLDARYGTHERLLASPFPSQNDVRYPCLYLDEEFLSSDDLRASDAASYISINIQNTALPMVHKVAATLVKNFKMQDNPHMLESATFALLRALIDSDRPGLAFIPAIEVIIGQPNASSWHRMLFSNGFLQRISASDARRCISSYANAVGEKLDAQKLHAKAVVEEEHGEKMDIDSGPTDAKGNGPQVDQPFVKITTLKSLAQILHGSTYIGDDASLEILSDLSEKVTHIDVRVSILKTLLSKLESNRPELWGRVLSTLEAFIPLASSLNEREPMTKVTLDHAGFSGSMRKTQYSSDLSESESDSVSSSEGSTETNVPAMPAMQAATTHMWQEESPMLGALMSHFFKLDGGQLLQLYLERIMIPLVNTLAEQTAQWTSTFLQKYASQSPDNLAASLPPIPKGIQIFDSMLLRPSTKSHRIPRQILDQIVAYLLFRINPPAQIRRLNQTLEDDPVLKSLPEVVTWLSLYGGIGGRSLATAFPFDRLANFDSKDASEDCAHVTAQTYQQAFLSIFRELLWAMNPGSDDLDFFVSTVHEGGGRLRPWWSDYGRPTIESMITYVNSIRTRDWQRDSHRTPAVLPDIFPWQLLLLSYPPERPPGAEDIGEHDCEMFAQQLAAILDEISGSVYHTKLQQIKNQMRITRDTIPSALYLGDISRTRLSWLTTPELLRVDLAAHIMCQVKGHDIGALGGRLKELLGTWVASENEEVRRTGYRLRGELLDANGEWLKTKTWW